MLSAAFLANPLSSWGDTPAAPTTTSALSSQLRSASSAFVVAVGVGCDVSTLTIASNPILVTNADATSVTSMACSPPRSTTHTRIANHTRHLTVPTAALASKKTRRRRSPGGGNEDDGNGDDFNDFFGGGGGDDGGMGGNGDDNSGDSGGPFDDSMGRWLQDVVLLWTIFCAWSTWNVLQHVSKTKPTPAPCLAAVTLSSVTSSPKASSMATPLSLP